MVEIGRYDPRVDKDALKELFEDFIENKSYFHTTWKKFEETLNKRVLDLQYRNAMIIAKEGGKIVGWGTISIFVDYLGMERAVIHQVVTKKEDSYKKGIEELIIKEILAYLKTSLKMEKVHMICPDSDSPMRSLLMKFGLKKSQYMWYEKDL